MASPGIVVTFFSALIGTIINVCLFYVKPQITWVQVQNGYQDALVLVIGAMIVRHQLRVVFLDSSAALHIRTGFRKFALWLLMPLGVTGALFLMAFSFSLKTGLIITLAYIVLFLVFWVVLIIGSFFPGATNEEKEKRDTAIGGVIVDGAFLAWWVLFFYKVMSGGQGKIDEDNFVFTILILVFAAVEIAWIYKDSMIERFSQLKTALL
ncbi:hypothetical protein L0E83_07735 [Marichromatium gracile]|uniref:hypothetical protein n=1 Tax=Marichromatium gracile TaxID=1048 RepID=UPI001F1A8876|nr:hypothetical protein [Marichromatium gracile]MCF1183327.1 hypothetical protein [Marichromatium gracile]